MLYMNEFTSGFIMLVLGILPMVLIVLDIIFFVKKKESIFFEVTAFLTGVVYMMLGFMLWDLPDYKEPLNIYGQPASVHEPVNFNYAPAILLFALWGLGSYFFLKYRRKKLPPLAEVCLLGGMYVGMGLSLVWMFQLLCGARPEGMPPFGNSFDWVEIFFQCLVPFIFLIHTIHLMVCLIKEKAQKQENMRYENVLLQRLNVWLLKGSNLLGAALIVLLPVLGLLLIILCLFGQQPDSIILAFTKTSDWVLSGETAPPPVAYDTHYLCTVSLRGHKKLVKPLRFGIRRGEKIVVNRQLCVANAFEQLLMEQTPRFHKAVRSFYDTYGYPISKHINSSWSADMVYLIMKPAEWVFLMVLYLVDEKPEDRIASQYLPIDISKNL